MAFKVDNGFSMLLGEGRRTGKTQFIDAPLKYREVQRLVPKHLNFDDPTDLLPAEIPEGHSDKDIV